jgi:Predicted transcriptional regulators
MHGCAYIITSKDGEDMGSKNDPQACSKLIQDNIDFEFFKTLLDPVRTEILVYLVSNGSKNIKEIAENFSQDRSVISRHLDLMYRYGIVDKTKENRNIYYEANSMFVIDKFDQTTNNIKNLLSLTTKPKE